MFNDDIVLSPAELRDFVFQTIKHCPLWTFAGYFPFVSKLEVQGTPMVGEWPNTEGDIEYTGAVGCYVVAPYLSQVVAAGPAVCTEASAKIVCRNGTGTLVAFANIGIFVNTLQDSCCLVIWCRQHTEAPGFWVQISRVVEGWQNWDPTKVVRLLGSMNVPSLALWLLPSPWSTRHAFKWEECPCETCQTQAVLRTMVGDSLAYERFQSRWAEVVEYGARGGYQLSYTTAVEKCTNPRCLLASHTIFVIQAKSLNRVVFIRKAQGKGAALDAVEWVHARLAACSAASLAVTESGVGACQPAE